LRWRAEWEGAGEAGGAEADYAGRPVGARQKLEEPFLTQIVLVIATSTSGVLRLGGPAVGGQIDHHEIRLRL